MLCILCLHACLPDRLWCIISVYVYVCFWLCFYCSPPLRVLLKESKIKKEGKKEKE